MKPSFHTTPPQKNTLPGLAQQSNPRPSAKPDDANPQSAYPAAMQSQGSTMEHLVRGTSNLRWQEKLTAPTKPTPTRSGTEIPPEKRLYLAAQSGDMQEITSLLAIPGINVNKSFGAGDTALHAAASAGHVEVVQALLGVDGILPNKSWATADTPLHSAARNGHAEVLKELLAVKSMDPNKINEAGETPFYLAAKHGHEEAVQTLLNSNRVDVNKADSRGMTPLSASTRNGQTEVVLIMLQAKGIKAHLAPYASATPLYIAARNGHTDIFNALVGGKHLDVIRYAGSGMYAEGIGRGGPKTMLYTAAASGHTEVVKAMLSIEGLDPNIPCVSHTIGDTPVTKSPLEIAAANGHLEVVVALLTSKTIKLSRPSLLDESLSDCARRNGHEEIAAILDAYQMSLKQRPKGLGKLGGLFHNRSQPDQNQAGYERLADR